MKKPAFTLIELLVVIVIIGILAAIGVGAFQGYIQKARDTKVFSFAAQVSRELKAQAAGKGMSAVGIYNFDEGSGTTPQDSSGNNHHMTLLTGGMTYETSDNTFLGNSFLTFDNGRLEALTNKTTLPGETTISFLIKLPESPAGYAIRTFTDAGLHGDVISAVHAPSRLNVGGIQLPNLSLNEWHHYLIYHKDGDYMIYIDGELAPGLPSANANTLAVDEIQKIQIGMLGGTVANLSIDNLEVYPFAIDMSNF